MPLSITKWILATRFPSNATCCRVLLAGIHCPLLWTLQLRCWAIPSPRSSGPYITQLFGYASFLASLLAQATPLDWQLFSCFPSPSFLLWPCSLWTLPNVSSCALPFTYNQLSPPNHDSAFFPFLFLSSGAPSTQSTPRSTHVLLLFLIFIHSVFIG